ncbi:type IV pilus assembly protein PilM [Butyrivibrio fibrisolvens]|uniref:Type IV pilus assembly protein PilM n=1 Tax=Butyrivibrio fibrisolvens TaxID=831 RepID=A0A1H9MCW4_BUTFI|nr:pilus assembly protein PilM [Butyrivibrio fibrisolvens]SER21528.1 type IV pilus assembly protein PilM [Butyrivibrio fibrisolvens]
MAKVLSIEIGSTLTEIVEMDYKVRNPRIYKSLMLSTPEGVMDDGMLYGFENYAQALSKMLKAKGFKAKRAIFSVSSNRIASREVEIPFLKENQIRDFVLANASDYFPVNIADYSISYTVLEKLQNEEGAKALRVNALAMPSEMLESYKEFAKAAGLELEAIDYDGNSLYQAVKKECSVGSQIVIKIDEKSSIVTVMKDGVQSLTRTVPYGIGEAVDTIIYSHIYSDNTTYSEAIGFLRGMKCVNPSFDMEAYRQAKAQERMRLLEQAKAAEEGESGDGEAVDNPDGAGTGTDVGTGDYFGFGSSDEQKGVDDGTTGSDVSASGDFGSQQSLTQSAGESTASMQQEAAVLPLEEEEEELSPQMKELRENVTFSFENLVSGLSTVLDLYYSRTKGQKVDRVVITGIGGTIQGMDDLIANTLDVPAKQIETLEGVQLGKVFKNGVFGEYIGCIGATISPVNFLVTEKKAKSSGTDIVAIGRLVLIGCVGLSAVLLAVSLPPYISAGNTNKSLRSQLQSVVSIIPIYQKYTLSKQAYEFVNEAYRLKDEPTAHIVEFLEEMEEKMPADILVQNISSDNTSVSITMTVGTKEEAADVYEQLCMFESVDSVVIDRISDDTSDEGQGHVTFTAVCVYAERSEEDTLDTAETQNDTEDIIPEGNESDNAGQESTGDDSSAASNGATGDEDVSGAGTTGDESPDVSGEEETDSENGASEDGNADDGSTEDAGSNSSEAVG